MNLLQLAALAAALHFNGTVLIQQHGKVIYNQSFGLADRAFQIPATNDTRYRIASITKAFTATIVLQLSDEGKLTLDGTLQHYLPDFKGEGADKITIQNLLNHTSGLPNFDTAKTYDDSVRMGLPMYETPQTNTALIAKYCTGKLTHAIGAVFDYNNCDYIVLGKIIEKLTGQTYEQALHQRILAPLNMTNSGIRHQSQIIPNLANTYSHPHPSDPLENDWPLYYENLSAAGAMYSTAEDLLKFSNALFESQRLIKPGALNQMLTPGLDQYGDGLWIRSFGPKKLRVVERYGQTSGAQSLLVHFPEEKLTIILLENTDETKLGDFYKQIARQLLP